jgi:HK97 family phage portal protein
MKFFGYEISLRKQQATPTQPGLMPISGSSRGWWPIIREPFIGAWQRNMEIRAESVLNYFAVYACVTMISDDISKMCLKLMQRDVDSDIGEEVFNPAFSPVLRKPNHYQNRILFIKQWIISKLIHGNTYILKERDNRNVVTQLYILDPYRVRVLVAPDGSVFYSLNADTLAGLVVDGRENVPVPASEIIHDINAPFYHPLCGVSPISACGLPALQGLNIERSAAKFFLSGSFPGGILTSPNEISDDQARDFKTYWDENFTGDNAGKVAVLSGGLTYQPLVVNAVDSQLIEQLKFTAEAICACFHVPPFMIGIGPMPAYNNIEALNQQYYSQCLQTHIEQVELALNEGLALPFSQTQSLEVEFELDDLLRMDTATKVKSWSDLVKGGIATPNEAREEFDLAAVAGGDSPYLQQQNYSLAALDKRDSASDPFATAARAQGPAQSQADGQSSSSVEGQDGQDGAGTAASKAAAAADRAMAALIRGIDHQRFLT